MSYPATLTSVSSGWVDVAGNPLSLATSADIQLNPGAVSGRPTMVAAVADASTDTVTVRYPEPVDCNGTGAAAAQFVYLEADTPVPQGALGISCDRTNTIVLVFDDGFIDVTDSNVVIRYRQSVNVVDRVVDLATQPVTTEEGQQASVQA